MKAIAFSTRRAVLYQELLKGFVNWPKLFTDKNRAWVEAAKKGHHLTETKLL